MRLSQYRWRKIKMIKITKKDFENKLYNKSFSQEELESLS